MEIRSFTPEELLGGLNEVERKNAPGKLYVRGDESILKMHGRVSIVGSRDASEFGIKKASSIARYLAGKGVAIVSGLALGIDKAAHVSAIAAGGKTIGVIGTPLNKSYPAVHASLQEKIADEHLLMSQFPIGTATNQKMFPQRNRTMALISSATIIIEAKEKSGTLHQGWEALRLGRMLLLLRESVEDQNLSWPAEFLRYGAEVIDSIDALDELAEMANALVATDDLYAEFTS